MMCGLCQSVGSSLMTYLAHSPQQGQLKRRAGFGDRDIELEAAHRIKLWGVHKDILLVEVFPSPVF